MIKFINKKAFTLVETMVAIAVFSLVMVAAMSALLNVIDANNKAKSIKTAINNISFALEGISKDMRMGTDYVCGTDENAIPTMVDAGCAVLSGGKIIGYRSPRADFGADNVTRKRAYYRFVGGQLEECLEKGKICTTNDFLPITSSEVKLTNVRFYVLGVQTPLPDAPNRTQPRMIMTVSGEAGSKDQTRTTFNLQTSISQRIRPENSII